MSRQKIDAHISDPTTRFWQVEDTYVYKKHDYHIIKYKGKSCEKQSAPNRFVYYEPSKALGNGCYGQVFMTRAYQINYKTKEITPLEKREKVVKVINIRDPKDKRLIEHEYAQGKKVRHLGMKAPVYSGDKGFLIMNRVPGENLLSLIEKQSIYQLPVQTKLELTHKLLLALRDQVSNLGIVHRDLKPENIMVTLQPVVQVHILDYGLAKNAGEDDFSHPGSPAYAAPELYNRMVSHDKPCDVYSMGKVIAWLWTKGSVTDWPQSYSTDAAQCLKNNQNQELQDRPKLLVLLQDMLQSEQKHRRTIDRLIAWFEMLYPEDQRRILPKGDDTRPEKTSPAPSVLSQPAAQIKHMNNINNCLTNLETYATQIALTHAEDSQTINTFVKQMRGKIQNQTSIPAVQFVSECQGLLSSSSINNCAANHKYVQYLLKNIAAALIGLGVFYGLACGINKLVTGRYTFFHNEISTACHQLNRELKSLAVGT